MIRHFTLLIFLLTLAGMGRYQCPLCESFHPDELKPRCVTEPAGDGDVRVEPNPDVTGWLLITVTVDGERMEFWTEQSPVDEFVDATVALVPSSQESAGVDVDGMIARFLEASS